MRHAAWIALLVIGSVVPAFGDVGPSGAFTTRVEIEVPSYHGLEPKVALAYSSRNGNDVAGVGWELEAVSTIVRASPGRGAPRFDENDIYLLDGEELVPCTMFSTSPGCTYPTTMSGEYFTTKIDDFRRIMLADGGWFIWDRDGRRTILNPQWFGPTSPYRWATSQVQDTHGNTVNYQYACDPAPGGVTTNRECFLDKILYGNSSWLTSFGGLAEVSFAYEFRPDVMTYAIGGDLALVRKRLVSIAVRFGTSMVRAYRLRYGTSMTTTRSLLVGVQEFGSDARLCAGPGTCSCTTNPIGSCAAGDVIAGSSLPERMFSMPSLEDPASDWIPTPLAATTSVTGGPPGPATPMLTPYQNSNWIADNDVIVIPADVNGDRRTDFVYPMIYDNGTALNALSLSTAISGRNGLTFVDQYFDIYWPRSDQEEFWSTVQWFAGNFNNDANTDIYIVMWSPTCSPGMTPNSSGKCPHAFIAVAVSKGDGYYELVTQNTMLPFELYTRNAYALTISAYASGSAGGGMGAGVSLALTNGDGGGAGVGAGTGGITGSGTSAGASTPGFTLWYNATVFGNQRWAVGDANGDGRDDVMVATVHEVDNTFEIGLTTALNLDGRFDDEAPEQMTGWTVTDTNVKKTRMFAADANGDGRTDWMVVHDHEANRPGDSLTENHISLNIAFADPAGTTYQIVNNDGHGPWDDQAHWLPNDVDGDGRADFVRIVRRGPDSSASASIDAFLSEGTGLDYRMFPRIDTGITWLWAHPWCTEPAPETMFFTGDYDGDGRGDLMAVWGTSGSCAFNGAQEVNQAFILSRPDGWTMSTRLTGQIMMVKDPSHPTQQAIFAAGDVNGDGTTDLLFGKGHGTTPHDPLQMYDVTTLLSPYRARDTQRYLVADVTGDGRDDLVLPVFMNPGYRIVTQLQQSDGSFLAQTTGVPGAPDVVFSGADVLVAAEASRWMIGDVGSPTSTSPDGKADLVYVDYPSGRLRIYTLFSEGNGSWLGRVFLLPRSYSSSGGHNWRMMRVNSDGRSDLVDIVYRDGLRFETFLANGDGTWADGSMPVVSDVVMSDTANWRAMDVNGDGRDELVHVRALFHSPSDATEIRTFFATADPSLWYDVAATPDVYNLDVNNWQPMEIDGDGAIDLGRLRYDRAGNQLVIEGMLSRGDGTWSVEDPVSLPEPSTVGDVSDIARYRIADTTGDGLSDLVHIAPFNDGGKTRTGIFILEHDGAGWRTLWKALEVSATQSGRYRVSDLDADGASDIYSIDPGVLLIHRDVPDDRIAVESNGIGASTTVAYRMSTDVHTNAPPGMRIPIASSATSTNMFPSRSDVTTTYTYDEARWSHVERRWIGFARFVAREGDTSYDHRFKLTDECGIAPSVIALYDMKRPRGSNLIRQSTFASTVAGPAPYTCLVTTRQDKECEGTPNCRIETTRWEYDTFGNAIRTYENDLDADKTDDRMTELPVWPNGDAYLVSLPAFRNSYRCAAWSPGSCVWEHLSSTLYEYDENVDDNDGAAYAKPPSVGELRRVRPWNNRDWSHSTTSFLYDGSGNLVAKTTPRGQRTLYGYNWADCPVRYYDVFPCAVKVTNENLDTPSLTTYLRWNTIAGAPSRVFDANGTWNDFAYDVFGRPQRTTDASGRFVETSYLSWGSSSQRIRTETTDGSSLDGVLWSEAHFDGRNRTYKSVRESNQAPIVREATYHGMTTAVAAESNEYDNVAARTWTTYERDVAFRVTKVTNPDTSFRTRSYEVGAIKTTDERGKDVRTSFDRLGRITTVRERLLDNTLGVVDSFTRYTYDSGGRTYGDSVDTITDDAGNTTVLTRDSLSLIREACDPDRGCRAYGYYEDDSLAFEGDAKGQVVRYQYDPIGRLSEKRYFDVTNQETRVATFAWDTDPVSGEKRGASLGRLTFSWDSASTVEDRWTYDNTGRITEEQRCVSGTCGSIGYSYDEGGRIDGVTYPNGEVVSYQFDRAGEVDAIPGYVSKLEHRADRQPSLMCLTNSTCTSWHYDPHRHWVTSIDVMKVSPPSTTSTNYLDRVLLGRDTAGLIGQMTTTAGSSTLVRKYGYDGLGRLTDVKVTDHPNLDRKYTYDKLGNLTSSTKQGTYTYDPAHVHAVASTDRFDFTYDANGNQEAMLDAVSGSHRRVTIWDQENRPERVFSVSSTNTWTEVLHGYDAAGKRATKTDATGRTIYFGDLAERDANGNWINYYYAAGRRVARRDSTGLSYYHTDHLGSPRLLTDTAGGALTRYEWEPFGELQWSSGPLRNNRTFTGALTDAESGLIHMGARSYDPAIGQFISADSIIPDRYSPQTLNRYAYALGNPMSFTDPSGHTACVEQCVSIVRSRGSDPGEWAAYAPESLPSAPPLVEAPPPLPSPPPLVSGAGGGGPGDGAGGGNENNYARDGFTGASGGSGGEPTPVPHRSRMNGDWFFFLGTELETHMPVSKFKVGQAQEALAIFGLSSRKGPYIEGAYAAGGAIQGPGERSAYLGAYGIGTMHLCCGDEVGHRNSGLLLEGGRGLFYGGLFNYPGNNWTEKGFYVGLKLAHGFGGIGMSWEGLLSVVTIGSVTPADVERWWGEPSNHEPPMLP